MAAGGGTSWGPRLLVIALVAGAAFFGVRLLRGDVSKETLKARYLVPKRGIAAFQVITGADLRWMENGAVPQGAFEHPEFVVGRVAGRALAAGQVIREEDFAGPPGTQSGVSSRLRPNRVASAVPLARLPGAREILKPDDTIDLLATRTQLGTVETKRIVSEARVLSISPAAETSDLTGAPIRPEGRGLMSFADALQGSQLPTPGGRAVESGWVILELLPQEAVELGRWSQLSVVLHGKLGPPQGGLIEPVELIEGNTPLLVVPESF